jgi:hypothetical protein
VLHRLRRPNNSSIENVFVGDVAGDLVAFLDQSVDSRALTPCGCSSSFLKVSSRRSICFLSLQDVPAILRGGIASLSPGIIVVKLRSQLRDDGRTWIV